MALRCLRLFQFLRLERQSKVIQPMYIDASWISLTRAIQFLSTCTFTGNPPCAIYPSSIDPPSLYNYYQQYGVAFEAVQCAGVQTYFHGAGLKTTRIVQHFLRGVCFDATCCCHFLVTTSCKLLLCFAGLVCCILLALRVCACMSVAMQYRVARCHGAPSFSETQHHCIARTHKHRTLAGGLGLSRVTTTK